MDSETVTFYVHPIDIRKNPPDEPNDQGIPLTISMAEYKARKKIQDAFRKDFMEKCGIEHHFATDY
jgi:hypothetical protein